MWGRASAGIVAGFLVAAGLTGLVAWLPPGHWQAALVPSLIAFIPLWMLAAIWAFSFRTAARAWALLGASAAGTFLLLWLLRLSGAVQ
ncbi:hypothetical protein [Stenotrophomonas sp. CFBP 13718]|uniref:hypothetical protein n=1 Tax=Stenotrophomonas sp. CFBP 13718 TaxID=2775304 RepID=UPI0017842079|nr:hypothetical protein [Stenotrophomonas sp. CFBP 13718]MBD8696333.1 hypothetical protein [Stenotrophomonas sp. CFBP 13718]